MNESKDTSKVADIDHINDKDKSPRVIPEIHTHEHSKCTNSKAPTSNQEQTQGQVDCER